MTNQLKWLRWSLMVLVLCASTAAVRAQTPVPTPPVLTDEQIDLMQRAQMVAEIKKLRAENGGLITQVTELKGSIEIYKKLDSVQEARVKDLKEAIFHSNTAIGINAQIEGLYKERIFDYKEENGRLRSENDKLRKSRDRRSLIFGIAGLALGHFLF